MTSPIPSESAAPTPYDLVPYGSQAFAQTHPDRLATLAHVFGLKAPDITACRVLELGCAGGGNLLPMACALPGSEFVGVDLSAAQVAEANAVIQRLGIANASIRHASITDIDDGWGRFDYIICHGVYSWVEPAVQDKILDIASRLLTDDGVAYVSYNTYPGWHMRESVRHMMRYHATPFDDAAERIGQARALLDFLSSAVPAEGNVWGQMLSSELSLVKRVADWYLYHEHLEPTNTPLYFHQFVERARGFGLQYLAEADFATMLTGRFEPAVAQTLERISADVIHLEQYMDFVSNRHFRQTLLCHAGRMPKRALSPALLHGLHVAAPLQPPDATGIDLRPDVPQTFRAPQRGQVTTRSPLSKAAFGLLGERWPLGWPIESLIEAARDRIAGVTPAGHATDDYPEVMQDFFQCFLSGLIELRTWQPPCVVTPGERPLAGAWAAHAAGSGEPVANPCHSVVALDAFSRALLALLDGRRDRAALCDTLGERVAAGSLALPVSTDVPAEPGGLRGVVATRLRDSLDSLTRHGLLAG